jgi:rubrerythrin
LTAIKRPGALRGIVEADSGRMPVPLDTPESFYAHALAIERDAVDRYREFAAYFAARREVVLSAICSMLERMESQHHAELLQACEGMALPEVEPAAYGWDRENPAEAGPPRQFYRIEDPQQVLEIALEGEIRAQRFFAWVAQTTSHPKVHELATAMAHEEARHIQWVTDAIASRKPLRA